LLERKCTKLENLLRTLHPDMDIAAMLNDSEDLDLRSQRNESVLEGEESEVDDEFEEDVDDDHFMEWHEDVSSGGAMDTFQDGPTSFGSAVASKEGYIGKSAGASLLRVIHKLLDIHRDGISVPLSSSVDGNSFETTMYSINLAEERLVVKSVRDSLVDSYFQTFNTFYSILHERTFRDQYAEFEIIPESSHFHMLLRMVVAIGSLCGSTQANSSEYCFYLSARSRLFADMLESGTVEQIQILLLMSNYLQKRDKPNTGYNLLGLAVRMAIGMGLHKESPAGKNTVRMECRRRLWWVLYLFDSGISITFGRPPIMADRVVDVKFPLNIDDTQLRQNDPVPIPTTRATPYTALIAFAKIATISARISERFFIRTRTVSSQLEVAEYMHLVESFDAQLSKWRNELPAEFYSKNCPPWLRAPRMVCLWREQNLRTLLYKGMLEAMIGRKLKVPPPQDYVERCMSAALNTVNSVGDYIKENPNNLWWGITWYATYFLFQADLYLVLVMIICYDSEPDADPVQSLNAKKVQACSEAIERSCEHFNKLKMSNPVSRKCVSTLEQLDDFLKRYRRKKGQKPTDLSDDDSTDNMKRHEDWIQQQQTQNTLSQSMETFENNVINFSSTHQLDLSFLDNLMSDSEPFYFSQ
jgi:transcriptional regulatory protein GAL4